MTGSFRIDRDPWIMVRTTDSTTETVSLRDLFRRAPDLTEIVGDLPTQAFAILRLALTVLHRAVDGPPDTDAWHDLHEAGGPPIARIDAYLDRVHDRLDLRHPTQPFFQTAGLHTAKDEVSGLGKLIADVPPGHPYFTTRSGAGLDRVSWPEAARWLVHTQAYDISGIKSGAVGDPRVKGGRGYPIGTGWAGAIGGLLVEGETLWETLLLNLIPQDSPEARFGAQDRPAWEAAPTTPEESDDVAARPFGPLDLYTWQSRRILLHGDDNGVTGVVLTNGDKITPQNRFPQEPMTAWRLSEAQMKAMGTKNPVYMPLAHLPERALWRGLESILPQAAPRGGSRDGERRLAPGALVWAGSAIEKNRRLRVRAIGMTYGTQNAVVTDIVEDRLALSAVLLSTDRPGLIDMVTATVRATEEAVRATGNLAADLVQAAGGTDERLVTGARSRAAERCYAGIDGPFRRWLASLGPETDSDEARTAWYATARRTIASVADALVAEASPTAWTGRTVGGRHLSTPEADGRYRYALAKALPRPEPATTDTPAPTTVGGIR